LKSVVAVVWQAALDGILFSLSVFLLQLIDCDETRKPYVHIRSSPLDMGTNGLHWAVDGELHPKIKPSHALE
jgi:hypothetical protein